MKIRMLLFAVLLATGCEILEDDLSSRQVEILAPADRVVVDAGQVEFRWRAMPGAAGYEFTLVRPSFATGHIVADTVIWADSLDRHFGYGAMLAPGAYEWCVRAFNSGYETSRQNRTLTIVPQTGK